MAMQIQHHNSNAANAANAALGAKVNDNRSGDSIDKEAVIKAIMDLLKQFMNSQKNGDQSKSGNGAKPASGAKTAQGGISCQGGGSKPGAGDGGEFGKGQNDGSASAGGPDVATDSGGVGSEGLINAINKARQENGLNPLKENTNLDAASAKNDAANNSTRKTAHHNGLINGSMGEITASNGAGETDNGAVSQWMNSPAHRDIMLKPDLTEVGASITGNSATANFK